MCKYKQVYNDKKVIQLKIFKMIKSISLELFAILSRNFGT